VTRREVATVVAFGSVLCTAVAFAGTFGGFSADGSSYLDDDARVCRLLAVGRDGTAKGRASCRPVRGPEERVGFKKPQARSRAVLARVRNRTLVLERDKVSVVTWSAPAAVDRIEAVYQGQSGELAVEYRSAGVASVIGFWLDPQAALPATTPGQGGAARVPDGAAPARMEGVWEQRQLACEQAGVKLELRAGGKFRLTIETKCQSDRDRVRLSGTWALEGGGLVLSFPQDEGPEEKMSCSIARCEGESCIRCAEGDVSFTVLPTKKRP
jgi:hypothetical protein